MNHYESGGRRIRIDERIPSAPGKHPALLLLHGSGGAVSYWMDRFAPAVGRFGISAFAPHYFDSTGIERASAEAVLNPENFTVWLAAVQDAVSYIAARPSIDAARIAVLGVSLGGYLALALATSEPRLRAVIEFSGGMPPGWEDRISPSMPPVLIVHGQEDTVVPVSEARRLDALLTARQVPHQTELLAGETHWFSASAQLQLLMSCASFLGKHL